MNSEETLRRIRDFESVNVTHLDPAAGWPAVWQRARGCDVWDAEGRRSLDLTAAFGVTATGHANPRVVAAGRKQMGTLLHGMGDVHPHARKAELLELLSEITFGRWVAGGRGRSVLTCTGSDAVEAALKTALLATGRSGVIAFEGAYHGLGYGALNATHREHFRARFRSQLGGFVSFVPFPACETCGCGNRVPACEPLTHLTARLDAANGEGEIGAVVVEPIQARGGIRVPPDGFLKTLRAWCDRRGALLILDEIYTGFGRTGRWFACEHESVVPDLVCVGKALSGGFPIAACVGRAELMERAWPASDGEAIHTSTFLGHPVGCAMALAQWQELKSRRLDERAAIEGQWLRKRLETVPSWLGNWNLRPVGRGLMAGIAVRHRDGSPGGSVVVRAMQQLLQRGILVLPEGADAEVLSLTPPLTIPRRRLRNALETIVEVLREVCS
jgi:4-aminobutyrate aminotransferase/(S)-3-amino-2-methylpropionate transaminase